MKPWQVTHGIAKYFGIIIAISACLFLASCIEPEVLSTIEGQVAAESNSLKGSCDTIEDLYYVQPNSWILAGDGSSGTKMGIVSYSMQQIKVELRSAVENVLTELMGNTEFIRILTACMTLVIVFYGMSIVLGIVPTTPWGVTLLLFKLLMVFYFATNYNAFSTIIMDFIEVDVIESALEFVSVIFGAEPIIGGDIGDMNRDGTDDKAQAEAALGISITEFTIIDWMFAQVWGLGFFKIIAALLFTGWIGWAYALAMLSVLMGFMMVVFSTLQIYIISQVIRSLLYVIAPVMFIGALFSKTMSMFEGWMKALINVTLQPIFLFAFLGIYFSIIIGMMNLVITGDMPGAGPAKDQEICYDVLWRAPGGKYSLWWWRFGKGGTESDIKEGVNPGMPIRFFTLLSMVVLMFILRQMMQWVILASTVISGSSLTTSGLVLYGIREAGNKLAGAVGKTVDAATPDRPGREVRPDPPTTTPRRE